MYIYGKKHKIKKNPHSDHKTHYNPYVTYICLNRAMARTKNADPMVSPMTADKMIKMSVRITSACENSLQVAQLGIQAPVDSSLR